MKPDSKRPTEVSTCAGVTCERRALVVCLLRVADPNSSATSELRVRVPLCAKCFSFHATGLFESADGLRTKLPLDAYDRAN